MVEWKVLLFVIKVLVLDLYLIEKVLDVLDVFQVLWVLELVLVLANMKKYLYLTQVLRKVLDPNPDIMQISIYAINNMPESGRNLAADACMGRTQLSPCIYNFSTRTIRASRYAMSAWYFFHAEPLISRFSLEICITLLQQLWQTVLVWNLYPIFILLNQLAVKITSAESFLWMHLHQFQYLYYFWLCV